MTSELPPRMRASSTLRPALVLALVAIALRLLLICAPGPEVAPAWVYPEEQHRGNIAQEVLRGPLLDIQDYHHAHNVGGSLVIGLLAVPFVAVLGDSVLAVRLPTVLMHATAVFLLFRLLARWRSRRAAWIGASFFAIAPPGYAVLSVTAWGTHLENNTFVLAALWVFLDLQERLRSGESVRARGFLLGLLSGFACYFGYSFAVALLVLAIVAFLRDRLFFARVWFAWALLGGVIGFLPWLRYNLQHKFAALSIYDRTLTQGNAWSHAGEALEKLGSLVAQYLPDALFFRDAQGWKLHWLGPVVAWSTCAALLLTAWSARHSMAASIARVFRRSAPPIALDLGFVSVLYAAVFCGAFAFTTLTASSMQVDIAHAGRYVAPLVPFLCIAVGIALDALWDGATLGRWLARAAAVALPAACLVAFATLVAWNDWGSGWRLPGSSDEEFARWFAWRYKTDRVRLERLIDGLEKKRDEEVRDGTLFVVAENLKSRLMIIPPGDARRGAFRETCAQTLAFLRQRVPERYRLYFEEPWPGEVPYAWSQREEFRRAYAEQHAATKPR